MGALARTFSDGTVNGGQCVIDGLPDTYDPCASYVVRVTSGGGRRRGIKIAASMGKLESSKTSPVIARGSTSQCLDTDDAVETSFAEYIWTASNRADSTISTVRALCGTNGDRIYVSGTVETKVNETANPYAGGCPGTCLGLGCTNSTDSDIGGGHNNVPSGAQSLSSSKSSFFLGAWTLMIMGFVATEFSNGNFDGGYDDDDGRRR